MVIAEVSAPFLSKLTEQRILERKRMTIETMIADNKAAFDEYRIELAFGTVSRQKQYQREKAGEADDYTATRQALAMFYLLKALGVDYDYIKNKTSVAKLLHVLAGYPPPKKDGKDIMGSSTIYQGVKKTFASSDRQQLADLEFVAEILRTLQTSGADGMKAMLESIERQIRSVKGSFEKKK